MFVCRHLPPNSDFNPKFTFWIDLLSIHILEKGDPHLLTNNWTKFKSNFTFGGFFFRLSSSVEPFSLGKNDDDRSMVGSSHRRKPLRTSRAYQTSEQTENAILGKKGHPRRRRKDGMNSALETFHTLWRFRE